MQEWLRTQLANGFSGFTGTSISASVRMSEQLLNELLGAALKDASSPGEAPESVVAPAPLGPLLKLVTKTELRAVDGAVVMNLEIRVE
jgi:hypothetical protein